MFREISNFVGRHPIGWSLFLLGISSFCAIFCLGSVMSHLMYARTMMDAFTGAAFPMFLLIINVWATIFNTQVLIAHLKTNR